MDTTVTPATKITVKEWTVLSVMRNTQIKDGALVPAPMVNLTTAVRTYLGDANGAPVQVLPDSNGPGTWGNVALDLAEEVTRADGSKVSVLDLLDALAIAAATKGASVA